MGRQDKVTIGIKVIAQTEKAVLVENAEDDEVWLPRSFITLRGEDEFITGECHIIELPEWLAQTKKII